jgi:hypothetical protein
VCNAVSGALAFGLLVYLATVFGSRLARLGDRRRTPAAQALRIALCAAGAVAGGTLLAHGVSPATIFALAILCAALGATCFLAALDSSVPVAIPGTALAILIGAALLGGDSGPMISACAIGAPFAITAVFARGSGSDWHDAVVAALGGAAFGLQVGLLAAGFACLGLALARPYLARLRSQPRPPARFASALAATFMVVLIGRLAIS